MMHQVRGRSREWWCRLTLRVLAVSFAVVGAQFFFLPDATVRSLNWTGAWFGDFPPAPESALRFYVSLATGYMMLVTFLAYVAQRDLHRHRDLVAFLALGKATTSLTSLLFYRYSLPAFIYLLNFLVDGAIAIGAVVIWFVIPSLPRRTPEARADPVMGAIAEAVVPSGGPFAAGAKELSVTADVEAFVAGMGSGAPRALRLGLRLFDFVPFVLPPLRLRRFSRLPVDERVAILDAWERSRWVVRRQIAHLFKLLVTVQFYSRPAIEAQLGYPHPLERVPRVQAVS
jgi:hypothetical protein